MTDKPAGKPLSCKAGAMTGSRTKKSQYASVPKACGSPATLRLSDAFPAPYTILVTRQLSQAKPGRLPQTLLLMAVKRCSQ